MNINKEVRSLFVSEKFYLKIRRLQKIKYGKNYHGKFKANYNYKTRPMRQKIKEKYLENGSFYIFDPEKFLRKKCRLFGKAGCFTMNKIHSFQIDGY